MVGPISKCLQNKWVIEKGRGGERREEDTAYPEEVPSKVSLTTYLRKRPPTI